jgi:hypothetical protein
MQSLWLFGGLGLGAGLMYLLDPEKGTERRDVVRGHAVDYGRQTGDFLDDTRRTLGRQAQAVLTRTRLPFRRQPSLGQRLLMQAEEMGLPLGLGILGCVGLGVGLGYLLTYQGSPQQRVRLREKARTYWHPTTTSRSSAVPNGSYSSESRRREDARAAHQA